MATNYLVFANSSYGETWQGDLSLDCGFPKNGINAATGKAVTGIGVTTRMYDMITHPMSVSDTRVSYLIDSSAPNTFTNSDAQANYSFTIQNSSWMSQESFFQALEI